ncbi:hypothetical protein AB0D10_14240 [Kitasatospora sp. NPDC048545]|uniref:hypothetical protein n=1 Tax=Kitasatospora sp. NPDC048545 TaxID=3157208 RepID=UPI0033F4CF85
MRTAAELLLWWGALLLLNLVLISSVPPLEAAVGGGIALLGAVGAAVLRLTPGRPPLAASPDGRRVGRLALVRQITPLEPALTERTDGATAAARATARVETARGADRWPTR